MLPHGRNERNEEPSGIDIVRISSSKRITGLLAVGLILAMQVAARRKGIAVIAVAGSKVEIGALRLAWIFPGKGTIIIEQEKTSVRTSPPS
jgi:hypothetical protein